MSQFIKFCKFTKDPQTENILEVMNFYKNSQKQESRKFHRKSGYSISCDLERLPISQRIQVAALFNSSPIS